MKNNTFTLKLSNADRKDVLRMTWQLIRKNGFRFGQALAKAYSAIRAKLKLATTDERGIWLKFRKVDGSIRNVLGTRNPAYIPDSDKPKTGGKADSNCVAYYDIWDAKWKCFRADMLISY